MDDLAWKCLGGFCSEASTTLFEFKLRGVFARGLVSPIQDLKETGKVWMADTVIYSCIYLIVPVDLSVLRHMKRVTLDYTCKYTGGGWFGNNTLDAKCSRSQPGKGQFLPSILLFVVLDVFHFVGLVSIFLHFYLENFRIAWLF